MDAVQGGLLPVAGRCRDVAPGRRKFRFKNNLVSLDASVIDLCSSLFDLAQFRRNKGGVKLHLLLDQDGCPHCFAVIIDGRRHEVKVAETLRFPAGSISVIDRGYVDYNWFYRRICRPYLLLKG